MKQNIYHKEFCLARKAIKYVGKHFLKNKVETITAKGDFDYYTDKDIKCENYIINKIKQKFSNDNFLTEESNSTNQLVNRTWIIDPIDGTHNYMNNIPIFCVQLAFFDKGECQFSIIYMPIQNDFYYAKKGEGAYLNGRLLKVNTNINFNKMIVNLDFAKSKDIMQINYNTMLDLRVKCLSFRNLGSYGCECAFLANGGFSIFINIGETINLWDCMPGILLCEEAGAISIKEEYKGYTYNVIALNDANCKMIVDIIKRNIDKQKITKEL